MKKYFILSLLALVLTTSFFVVGLINAQEAPEFQTGWLIKNKQFAEVFYVDQNLALHWIVNENAAKQHFGSDWNQQIHEYDSLETSGLQFGDNLIFYWNWDVDNDGLFDGYEVDTYGTDFRNPDTDGDGYFDGIEVENGFDPNGPGLLADKTEKSCAETDGGYDIHSKSQTTISTNGSVSSYHTDTCFVFNPNYTEVDACTGGGCSLDEGECYHGEIKRTSIVCPNGCKDGACIK